MEKTLQPFSLTFIDEVDSKFEDDVKPVSVIETKDSSMIMQQSME